MLKPVGLDTRTKSVEYLGDTTGKYVELYDETVTGIDAQSAYPQGTVHFFQNPKYIIQYIVDSDTVSISKVSQFLGVNTSKVPYWENTYQMLDLGHYVV